MPMAALVVAAVAAAAVEDQSSRTPSRTASSWSCESYARNLPSTASSWASRVSPCKVLPAACHILPVAWKRSRSCLLPMTWRWLFSLVLERAPPVVDRMRDEAGCLMQLFGQATPGRFQATCSETVAPSLAAAGCSSCAWRVEWATEPLRRCPARKLVAWALDCMKSSVAPGTMWIRGTKRLPSAPVAAAACERSASVMSVAAAPRSIAGSGPASPHLASEPEQPSPQGRRGCRGSRPS
mmetsp:Transcript_73624/g.157933  ORF Transcript_73624/g.157933 Transcript_73624/m.157933 type:complete len:239 (+) Transcript_73624:434-1150(+)